MEIQLSDPEVGRKGRNTILAFVGVAEDTCPPGLTSFIIFILNSVTVPILPVHPVGLYEPFTLGEEKNIFSVLG